MESVESMNETTNDMEISNWDDNNYEESNFREDIKVASDSSQDFADDKESDTEHNRISEESSLSELNYIDPNYLQELAKLEPDYNNTHEYLLSNNEGYKLAFSILRDDVLLDNYLKENYQPYQDSQDPQEKSEIRDGLKNVLSEEINNILESQGKELLAQQKQQLINEVRLNNFSHYLGSNNDTKPLLEFGDNLYSNILSERGLEDTEESRSFFNRAVNSFLIDLSNIFGINERSFAKNFSNILKGTNTHSAALEKFQAKANALQDARNRAKSITSHGVDTKPNFDYYDDESWARID